MELMMKKIETINPLRRTLVGSLISGALVMSYTQFATASAESKRIDVWKGPWCSCCKDWITHLEDNDFSVTSFEEGNSEARKRLGMPVGFGSCHTAEIQGYAIEGHVPARDIYRLLEEKPDAIGLSVPAMPRGSPGMDGPAYSGVKDPYDVLLIGSKGVASVFQSYR
jgi:hypothetical protein